MHLECSEQFFISSAFATRLDLAYPHPLHSHAMRCLPTTSFREHPPYALPLRFWLVLSQAESEASMVLQLRRDRPSQRQANARSARR